MKRIIVIALLFFAAKGLAQNEITYFALDSSVVYVDNSKGAHFTVKFPGDSIKTTGMSNAYMIGDEFVQFLKRKYDRNSYTNKSKPEKEIAVLKDAMNYEVDYLRDEIFKQDLDIKEEVFLNDQGKRFHLWSYAMPEKALEEMGNDKLEQKVSQYYFLNCIVNDFISGMMLVSYEGESIEQKIESIKNISNSVDIFGGPIDIDGTYAKMEAEEDNTTIEFINESKGFELDIPNWANLVKSDLSLYWMATMPDINNVKNAISLNWFEKEAYKGFKDFNKEFVLGKKIGDGLNTGTFLMKKELKTAENMNGVTYKIQAMFGGSLYDCQYVTFETKTHFVLVKFIATPDTYELNVEKFNDFISNIKILD
ncbi:hypothetical protein [uncultured Psychroserpens sp.]|uniref:hypothetical protein n=1 Tax=uncultured Psychroserpens sp. TaxID=255436 RepID=UPI00263A21E5|nr:hypothetical protein [uncultured Psychroserpens sp.]